jgi:septum formation protein
MIILASQSPRRQDLLRQAGIPFRVAVPGVAEVRIEDEGPAAYVERLAREKALAVPADPGDWVLAADTTVALDEHVLEKPENPADAARMLRLLSGRVHEVLTGVCVRHAALLLSGVEITRVEFAALTDGEIEDYANSGEPLDKAGGYAIQGRASKFIPRVEGCYFNVVGLPVARVYRMLREAGYHLPRG